MFFVKFVCVQASILFYMSVSIFECTKASVNLSYDANFILFNSIECEKRSELFEKVYTSIQH